MKKHVSQTFVVTLHWTLTSKDVQLGTSNKRDSSEKTAEGAKRLQEVEYQEDCWEAGSPRYGTYHNWIPATFMTGQTGLCTQKWVTFSSRC